jgi:prepilin-type N-terminal cleavage/methylation domain-containing protein
MRRSGLTLIELAIVLVIIGILFALSVRGKNILQTAKIRSEVRKIEKMQNTVVGWLASTPGDAEAVAIIPFVDPAKAQLDWSFFQEFTPTDLQQPNGDWTLHRGFFTDNSTGAIASKDSLSLYISTVGLSPNMACFIELYIDDKLFTSGNGRSTITPVLKGVAFAPCDDWGETYSSTNTYSYRLM